MNKSILTDEIIGKLWYESKGFYHVFARLVEQYILQNAPQ